MKIFEPLDVDLSDLLLDPNNPRLVQTLNDGKVVPDSDIEAMQSDILELFDPEGRPDHIDTSDLDASMRRLGYVGIDQIVVRRLHDSPKYVVIEGNRRLSTLKRLVQEYEEGLGSQLEAEIVSTFRRLRVMNLLTDGVSAADVQHRISVILGLRHHGSLLEWEPLPKAFNIYNHYMDLMSGGGRFQWEAEKGREVASILSIKSNDVRASLRTYVAYLQLRERAKIDSQYYSLIESAVTNRNLTAYKYFDIDDSTFRLTPRTFERLFNICQLDKRSGLEPAQIIIPRPQEFSKLGYIVERANKSRQHTVRTLAAALLEEVESGELNDEQSLATSLEAAWYELKAFEEGVEWVTSLKDLLTRQQEELPLENYQGEGNDKQAKDQLQLLLGRFQAILGLDGRRDTKGKVT